MKKVRIGLVGTGVIGNVHLEGYAKLPEVEIAALCDLDAEKLNAVADKYGMKRRYTDIDVMLTENPDLDAVDVCVWNCNHARCAIKALDAGHHVLCEKPMAYNAKEAAEMLAAEKRSGKLLMIGFSMRFSDRGKIAKDFVDNGYVGEVYYTKAVYVRRHGAPGGWFTDVEKSGGGPVIDLGVHVIDLTRYLMGNPKPVSVSASVFNKLGKRDNVKMQADYGASGSDDLYTVEDSAVALIHYDNGGVTLLETAYHINGDSETGTWIYGTKGGLELTDKVRLFTDVNDYLADVNLKTGITTVSHHTEMAHFVDCIANNTPCMAKAEDGYQIMRILDAIYESARTGREVRLDS